MTRARDVANFLSGSATFTGTVTVPTPVHPTDAANKAYVDNASGSDIGIIDDLSGRFDGIESRFQPTNGGAKLSLTNPYKLLITVNGIVQSVYTPDYVWQSPLPKTGFQLDSSGYLSFAEVPPAGSSFNGRVLLGPTTNVSSSTYPFKATDILLGA